MTKKQWPPRSPDLNLYDYFLWGDLQSKVYKPLPKTLDDLKKKFTREIQKIRTLRFWNQLFQIKKGCHLLIEKNGGHINKKQKINSYHSNSF